MALFHAKENSELMAIAIQLFQQPAENNPVSCYLIKLVSKHRDK